MVVFFLSNCNINSVYLSNQDKLLFMSFFLSALIAGACFLLLYIILINVKKVNVIANKWFAGFIFCLLVLTSVTILIESKTISESSIVVDGLSVFIFLISPFFYLSITYFIKPTNNWKHLNHLHFWLSYFYLFLFILSLFLDENPKVEDVSQNTVDVANYILASIVSIQVFTYCFLSYKKIVEHQKNILLYRSTTENIDLGWLKKISLAVIIMGFFFATDLLFQLSEKFTLFDIFTSFLYLITIMYITFFWLKQEEIYPYSIAEKNEIISIIEESNLVEDKKKKLISDENLDKIKSELLKLMETEKPFLDSELNLVKLANKMNLSSHLLSYAINNGFDENFFQFINRYRIEEAKKLILNPKMNHLSLLGIGFEVGFNSKTVFNTTFKKITGKTPSEYKKNSSDL